MEMADTTSILFAGMGPLVVAACVLAVLTLLVAGGLAAVPSALRASVIVSGFALSAAVGALLVAGTVYFADQRNMFRAVAHVHPDDRAKIQAMGEQEAKVPLRLGAGIGLPCAALAAVVLVTGARRLVRREEGAR